MVEFPATGVASQIVTILRNGPLTTTALIRQINKQTGGTTVQGVYKSLRQLKEQGIVLVYKKEAVLNQAWLRQLEEFTLLTEHAYRTPRANSGHFLQLRDGDRIKYEFKDPIQVDVFWNHVLYLLFDALPEVDRWFAYASHCWFLIAQREDELALRDTMLKRKIQYLFTVPHKTPLDRLVAKDFTGTTSQYHMSGEPLFTSRKNHLGIVLNVFGDYIIEAHYDKDTTEQIEKFYHNNTTLTAENQTELSVIVSTPSKIKFMISRDSNKAAKLARSFEKNFYIPKP